MISMTPMTHNDESEQLTKQWSVLDICNWDWYLSTSLASWLRRPCVNTVAKDSALLGSKAASAPLCTAPLSCTSETSQQKNCTNAEHSGYLYIILAWVLICVDCRSSQPQNLVFSNEYCMNPITYPTRNSMTTRESVGWKKEYVRHSFLNCAPFQKRRRIICPLLQCLYICEITSKDLIIETFMKGISMSRERSLWQKS